MEMLINDKTLVHDPHFAGEMLFAFKYPWRVLY